MAEKEEIPKSMLKKFRKLAGLGRSSTPRNGNGWHDSLNSSADEESSLLNPEVNNLPSTSKNPTFSSTKVKDISSQSNRPSRSNGLDIGETRNGLKYTIREQRHQECSNVDTVKIVSDFLEHADLRRCLRLPFNEKQHLFYELRMGIKYGPLEQILKYSEEIFFILIENYREADEEWVTKGLIMELFGDICASLHMLSFWSNSVELLLHIVFTGQGSKDSVVCQAAKDAYSGIVQHVEVITLLRCVITLIYTVTEMDLVRAIDMLKKLIEKRSVEICDHHMKTIMYALRHVIKVNKGESKARIIQTAIDCMASLHFWVGRGRFQRVHHLLPESEIKKIRKHLDCPVYSMCFSDIFDGLIADS